MIKNNTIGNTKSTTYSSIILVIIPRNRIVSDLKHYKVKSQVRKERPNRTLPFVNVPRKNGVVNKRNVKCGGCKISLLQNL